MRVAVDAGPAMRVPTGVGRYTLELIAALERRELEIRRFAVALRGRNDGSIARLRAPARLVQAAWLRSGRPRIERLLGDAEVVHGTNFVLPPLGGRAGVVTVHDLSFLRDDVFPGGERLRDLVPWSIERAARVVTPTAAIADEVRDRYGIREGAVTVTHEGVAGVFFGATPLAETALGRMGITPPYVLAAGTLEPRKNLARLLAAWREAGGHRRGWTLVLAGPQGWGPGLEPTDGVVFPGWVGDETLPGLMAAAEIFCYPSLYEGFGLPPLEAMAAGTATVVGRYSAAQEVVGDGALVVDPLDTGELARALGGLMDDPDARRALALAGRARATGFTWDATATATMKAYEEALAGA